MESVPSELLVSWLAIHASAVLCAVATRLSAGSRAETAMHLLFFVSLAVVGVTAWFCQHLGFELWVPSGVAMVIMVVTAVSDFRRTHEPVHVLHPGR
jgi:hypothetical protein